MQRGGQSFGAAGPGVDLGRGIGEFDDMLVAVVNRAVEHFRYRARPVRERCLSRTSKRIRPASVTVRNVR